MDIGEYKHLLSQMKELKLTLGLSFTGTNGTIEEFSGDTKLKGVAWSSTKSYFSAGYTPMLDGLSDVFYTAITTLENFIRAFESEVTASGVKLDLDHLQDLQRRRDELQREKTNWLHQIAEQASKIPGLGHLFDDYSVLQAEKKVQLMEDFRDFIHRHDSDFSELNGLIEQVLLGLEELGKQRSFNGDKQGYSPINFMNLNWSKNLASYHEKHGEEVKKIQKKDMENFKNMAEVAGAAVAMESFGMNSELSNMRTPLYEAGKEYFSGDGVSGPNSNKVKNKNNSQEATKVKKANEAKVPKLSSLSEVDRMEFAKQYRLKAPIDIPETAIVNAKTMNAGYEQITYKWNDGQYKYEVRWHTKTPGAPIEQGNTWVIQRTIPGNGGNKPKTFFKIGNNEWVEGHKWYEAINARKAGTATPEQIRILDQGHWKE